MIDGLFPSTRQNFQKSGSENSLARRRKKQKSSSESDYGEGSSEHRKNARKSTENKHEKGQARKGKDRGGEKGDVRRKRYK